MTRKHNGKEKNLLKKKKPAEIIIIINYESRSMNPHLNFSRFGANLFLSSVKHVDWFSAGLYCSPEVNKNAVHRQRPCGIGVYRFQQGRATV